MISFNFLRGMGLVPDFNEGVVGPSELVIVDTAVRRVFLQHSVPPLHERILVLFKK